MAAGRLRALVCTASLDLGVDWGDVDLVIQMGAPKGSSRLLQRIGRANHRLDEPSEAILVPGNRFEYLEARAALDAVERRRARRRDLPPRRARRARPACHGLRLRRAVPRGGAARRGASAPRLMRGSREELFGQVLAFIESGGYALRAYDKFQRLTRDADGIVARLPSALHPAAPDERRDHRRCAALRRPLPRRPQARHGRGQFRRDAVARATPSFSPGWCSRSSGSTAST